MYELLPDICQALGAHQFVHSNSNHVLCHHDGSAQHQYGILMLRMEYAYPETEYIEPLQLPLARTPQHCWCLNIPYWSSTSSSPATGFFGGILTGSTTNSICSILPGVGGGDEKGEGGSAGSSGGSSSDKLLLGRRDSCSMLRLRTRSYREGLAFRRGRNPTFINLQTLRSNWGEVGSQSCWRRRLREVRRALASRHSQKKRQALR
jgi:hypothetical protein